MNVYFSRNVTVKTMELFARISCAFTAGDLNIENNDYINEVLNNKLKSFVNSKDILEYRILCLSISR